MQENIDISRLSTVDTAMILLGQQLCHETGEGIMSGIIVETEAYLSRYDPASHAAKGLTKRNAMMFGPPGRAYVYFIYGNHYCLNVVTGPEGTGEAVLIRALEPLEGLDLMYKNRYSSCRKTELTNGPGKLCRAFGIDKSFNGHDLNRKPLYIKWIEPPENFGPIIETPRIGISSAQEKLLRFVIRGNKYLSRRENLG